MDDYADDRSFKKHALIHKTDKRAKLDTITFQKTEVKQLFIKWKKHRKNSGLERDCCA